MNVLLSTVITAGGWLAALATLATGTVLIDRWVHRGR